MRFKAFLCLLCLLAVLLPGCAQEEPCQVAATTLPVYQFTAALCEGTGISVKRLITQQVSCLHDYSLNVAQARTLEQAQVVVISGGGLEEFMEDSLSAANRVIDSSQGVSVLECEEHHHEEEHHHHDRDAHIWLSPANAKIMARNIAAGLSEAYPEHQTRFGFNLQQLEQRLDELEHYGQNRLKDLSCRELVTFHDGFCYFGQD